jgi:hypothetical protein
MTSYKSGGLHIAPFSEVSGWKVKAQHTPVEQQAATLAAFTSFEFFDALAESSLDEKRTAAILLDLARKMLAQN